jgi:Sulfotransferase domain
MPLRRDVLPTFALIGAMKAGTTSIYGALSEHPQVFMCHPKEPQFFTNQWDRGLSWYEELFAPGGDALARGDASTSYTDFPRKPDAAARIHRVVPDIRLVYAVRDPVARMRSHYRHRMSDGTECRPVESALLDDLYLDRSRYGLQVQQYLRYFAREQLLVLQSEDLLSGGGSWARLLDFIGVDSSYLPPVRHRNSSESLLQLRPSTRAFRRLVKNTPLYRHAPRSVRRVARTVGARRTTANDDAIITPELRDEIWSRLESDMREFAELTGITFESESPVQRVVSSK